VERATESLAIDSDATSRANGVGFTPVRFGLLLAVLLLVVWPEILIGSHTFIARDYGFFGYPLAHYHRGSFWRGEIPFWNPLSNCGLPFLAQWNTMTLYPGTLFYLLFSLPWSLGVFCLLHLFWGGLGMHLLARKWTGHTLGAAVAGIAFAFAGILLNSLMWPNNIAALGWMPWVVLATERAWQRGGKAVWAAAVVGAMQMLTGGPEITLLTWVFLLLLVPIAVVEPAIRFGQRALRFGSVAALVGLLSAAQILPFLDLLRQSQRDEHFFESAWPMPLTGCANLLVPLFECTKTPQGRYFQWDQDWTASYYAGSVVLALALLAAWKVRSRYVRFLSLIVGLGLVLALGERGHLYPLVKKLVPQIGFMRYPIKLVVWVSFGLPVLSAFGVRWLLDRSAIPTIRRTRAVLGLATVLTSLLAGLVGYALWHPQPSGEWKDTVWNGLSRGAFLWIGLALCLRLRRPGFPMLRLFLVAVVAADLLTAVPLLSPTVPRVVLLPDSSFGARRPDFGNSRAMVTLAAHRSFNTVALADLSGDFLVKRSGLFANANLLDAIPKVDGFYSLYLKRIDAVLSVPYLRTNQADVAPILVATNRISFAGLYTFLGVSLISSEGTHEQWVSRTNFMPLFSTGQRPIFTNDAATLAGLFRPGFDPRRCVYLPLEGGRVVDAAVNPPAGLRVTRLGANALEALVEAAEPSLVVVAQSHHANWRASLNGTPVEILRANYAFQAVSVPAGRYLLRFRYIDLAFLTGLAAAVLTLLAALVTRLILDGPAAMAPTAARPGPPRCRDRGGRPDGKGPGSTPGP
jgi:hypothetical protein